LKKLDFFTTHSSTKLYNCSDCLRENLTIAHSDSGEGVLKSQSPGNPSNPDLVSHNPNGHKRLYSHSPNAEATNN
jgi:hypothetical protein